MDYEKIVKEAIGSKTLIAKWEGKDQYEIKIPCSDDISDSDLVEQYIEKFGYDRIDYRGIWSDLCVRYYCIEKL